MFTITCRIPFDAAHRLLNHPGKCRFVHGHSYVAEVTLARRELDNNQMVRDFGDVKEQIKTWIDTQWDHNILLNSKDPLCPSSLSSTLVESIFGGKPPFVFENFNPTVEKMAEALFVTMSSILENADVWVDHVKIRETENCWAEIGR